MRHWKHFCAIRVSENQRFPKILDETDTMLEARRGLCDTANQSYVFREGLVNDRQNWFDAR